MISKVQLPLRSCTNRVTFCVSCHMLIFQSWELNVELPGTISSKGAIKLGLETCSPHKLTVLMTSKVGSVCSLHGDFNCVTERDGTVFRLLSCQRKLRITDLICFLSKKVKQGWNFLSESIPLILREVSEVNETNALFTVCLCPSVITDRHL